MIPFIDFNIMDKPIREAINQKVKEVINSGWYILGNELKSFEKEFAQYNGSQYCVGVGSGTEALHLSLFALNIKPGDEVITVANTAVPTVSAISFSGAKPVFVDIKKDTMLMDPDLLKKAITPKTKAIIPVHLFGHLCEMDQILEIANEFNIPIVEDCAQAHGAEYKGKKAGNFGTLGCFSFYPTKNLGAYGDAGAIITNDKELYEKLKLVRNYGETRRYHNEIIGFNSRLDEIQAGILRVKLKYLDEFIGMRRNIAKRYSDNLKGVELPFEKNNCKHSYHLYVVRSDNRNELQKKLDEKGIKTLIHYPIPIHMQKAYSYLGYKPIDLPVALHTAERILSLPFYPNMPDEHIQEVIEVINSNFI